LGNSFSLPNILVYSAGETRRHIAMLNVGHKKHAQPTELLAYASLYAFKHLGVLILGSAKENATD
jgi:hypothetical protein